MQCAVQASGHENHQISLLHLSASNYTYLGRQIAGLGRNNVVQTLCELCRGQRRVLGTLLGGVPADAFSNNSPLSAKQSLFIGSEPGDSIQYCPSLSGSRFLSGIATNFASIVL
jgi:hypothetical protein